ncbi:hypothetical protein F53441_6118 [Fusarium austroafricanum]|uniref:Uncharacterized protein n=1 Tax=Fusarium austroafricanum TaxID=2364996 RepID=A0A8H4KIG9_9HYPO|nr:hypothetical protein F53441_6118 [Fusarium austroafricanum]
MPGLETGIYATTKRHHRTLLKKGREKKTYKVTQQTGYANAWLLTQCAAEDKKDQDHEKLQQTTDLPQAELECLNKAYIDLENLGDRDLVDRFMTRGGNEPRRMYQADMVNLFCHSAEIQELQSNSSSISLRKACLVDDRTNNGTVSMGLGDRKPLTPREMYVKLMEKRFHGLPTTDEPKKLNADRRLVFITDLDSHALVSLMATAPTDHTKALTHFFYSYIAFHPYIGVLSKPSGLATFAFSFHLPFYSWTCAQHEPRDVRLKRDGIPLRKVHDMSFLGGNSQMAAPKVDYLCQVQIAVCIARTDDKIWTGYCLVDTYCQPGDQKQRVEDYCDSDFQFDPFTDGKHDANLPILNPGDYFLASLECQLLVFKNEWMKTAQTFKQKVEAYVDEFKFVHGESGSLASRDSQQPLVWLRQTRRKLTQLVVCLETTIDCWDNFTYPDRLQTVYGRQSLVAVRQTFMETKNCLKELYNIRTLCDEHEKALNLHSIDEQYRLSRLQAQVAESTQALSCFLLYVLSPITLAAAILSMQEKAIPGFLGPNKLSLFLLAPMLMLFLFLVSSLVQYWKKIQLYISHSLSQLSAREGHGIEFV